MGVSLRVGVSDPENLEPRRPEKNLGSLLLFDFAAVLAGVQAEPRLRRGRAQRASLDPVSAPRREGERRARGVQKGREEGC